MRESRDPPSRPPIKPPLQVDKDTDSDRHKILNDLRDIRDIHKRVLNHVRATNSSPSSHTTEAAVGTKIQETKFIPSLSPVPLPRDLQNCDLSSKKDALSALSRATTDECKGLIHNITCLAQAGRLYDLDIKNTCPYGRNPGRNFVALPYSQGTGPPVRVVFLLSLHGRAFRQVKRLFKAIYHTDHYYFVHVDSVSC